MVAMNALYEEIRRIPAFRDATTMCRGPHGKYFIKLCRSRERRFLLRNEARIAERLSQYEFCPPFIGFLDLEDTSCLVFQRVPGKPVRNIFFITRHILEVVSTTLNRVNEVLAEERLCQLDPSPNNIIVDPGQSRVWYVDYELCAPFGTEAEIIDGFGVHDEEERSILQQAFKTAGCQYKPAHIVEYGDAFNRYMNNLMIGDLKRRSHPAGFLRFLYRRSRQYWQRAKQRSRRAL